MRAFTPQKMARCFEASCKLLLIELGSANSTMAKRLS
jgi:hypothetical protein